VNVNMSADGVIQIDLLLKGKDQFVTDVRFIDDLLEHLGTHTAKQMDASFQQQASKVINEAKETKEQLKETMNHPFTFRLSAETEKANAQISETKQFLHEIPKRKKTVFDADTDNFTNHLRRLKETTSQTESRFSRLKEIMLGTFAGSMITSGIQQLIGGLKNARSRKGIQQRTRYHENRLEGVNRRDAKRWSEISEFH